MSDDNTVHSDETEITSITDSYGEPIEYDGNPAHAEGYLAALGEYPMGSSLSTPAAGRVRP